MMMKKTNDKWQTTDDKDEGQLSIGKKYVPCLQDGHLTKSNPDFGDQFWWE